MKVYVNNYIIARYCCIVLVEMDRSWATCCSEDHVIMFIQNARLTQGLVFDDEIAALQRMHIRCDFGSGRGSRQSRGGTRAISGKRRSGQSRVGEKNRTDAGAG